MSLTESLAKVFASEGDRLGPPEGLVLGHTLEAWRDPLGIFIRTMTEYGGVAKLRFGPIQYYLVSDVAPIHHVLVENHRNYTKSRNYRGIKLVLGNGLVTSEGDFWRRQRRLAQPGFHRDRLQSFVTEMVDTTRSMLERWDRRDFDRRGAPRRTGPDAIDLHREMNRLTFRIVCRTLFQLDMDGEADEIGRAVAFALEYANEFVEQPFRPPPWVPTPKNLRFRRAIETFDQLVQRMIEERRRTGDRGDLLSMLMAARDEDTGEGMTDRQLRDEVVTLVLAGHETTANALSWTFTLLSKHPDARRRLEAEVDVVLGDRTPTMDDLTRLPYTNAVVSEAMRLYPPVWVIEREAIEKDRLGAVEIPAGATVGVSPYALHRNPAYWPNPEGFDPERFLPEHAKDRPRGAYLPFSTGPRQCIGNSFAMMEAAIVLASIARRYRLPLVPERPVEPEALTTLRPKGGVWVTLDRRT